MFTFSNKVGGLVETSRFREKIRFLEKYPDLGREFHTEIPMEHPSHGQPSNCYGTLDWILDDKNENRLPLWMPSWKFSKKYLIEENNLNGRKHPDCLVLFWSGEGDIQHAALYIGECEKMEAIAHQPDTGEIYSIDTPEFHKEFYPECYEYDFYKIPVPKTISQIAQSL